MARNYSNITVETTLVSSISPSDTIIDVVDNTGFPASFPFSLVIDHGSPTIEVVTVTGQAGQAYTVLRGQDGTAAQAHAAGAVVVHAVTARDLREPQEHIDANTGVHGIGGASSVVGTNTPQTLTNKTIAAADNTITMALGDLSDADVPTPADGDVLTFDSSTNAWVASNPSHVHDLGDLGDVDTSGAVDGDALVFDTGTSKWVPGASVRHPQVRLWDGSSYQPVSEPTIYIGQGTPSSPENGDIWLDTTNVS